MSRPAPEHGRKKTAQANETSLSLLQRAAGGEPEAWHRLVAFYQPLIRGWLTRYDVHPREVQDLTQEVLAILVKELRHYRPGGFPGAFRSWLRVITVNRAREFWRAGKCGALVPAGAPFQAMIEQLADPSSELAKRWDREHDAHVIRKVLKIIETDFAPTTARAFRLLALEQRTPQEVAEQLGLTPAAVYAAKSRVLQRLREEAGDLLA